MIRPQIIHAMLLKTLAYRRQGVWHSHRLLLQQQQMTRFSTPLFDGHRMHAYDESKLLSTLRLNSEDTVVVFPASLSLSFHR